MLMLHSIDLRCECRAIYIREQVHRAAGSRERERLATFRSENIVYNSGLASGVTIVPVTQPGPTHTTPTTI